jgi:hypothetical protein
MPAHRRSAHVDLLVLSCLQEVDEPCPDGERLAQVLSALHGLGPPGQTALVELEEQGLITYVAAAWTGGWVIPRITTAGSKELTAYAQPTPVNPGQLPNDGGHLPPGRQEDWVAP